MEDPELVTHYITKPEFKENEITINIPPSMNL